MIHFRFFVFFLLSSAFAFGMEKPHESSDWPALVQRQAAIEAAKDFLRQKLNTGQEGVLCSQFKGAGFTAENTYYSNLGFTVDQLLQAHQQLMEEQAKILKASRKRGYTEI